MNIDAGRGMWLFVTLRLENGEALPFLVDTGTTNTCVDKSLEPRLGKRLDVWKFSHDDNIQDVNVYAAPKLFLGDTQLLTGSRIQSIDMSEPSSFVGRPVMGILGMDCLRHYCIQMDFGSGTIRFLNGAPAQIGEAFPLLFRYGLPWINRAGLLGGDNTPVLVDSGNNHDGDLESDLFRQKVGQRALRVEADMINGKPPRTAWLPKSVWNGETYTNLLIGRSVNSIGLRFLARHRVTFDFPKQTLYLRKTSGDPLVDENMTAAAEFLKTLKQRNLIPGWPEKDEGTIALESHPDFGTYDFRRDLGSTTYHYTVTRSSKDGAWKWQKAWRTDQSDHIVEEYPIP